MEIDIAQEIETTRQIFRNRWRQEWQESYCHEHNLYNMRFTPRGPVRDSPALDRAPDPPWEEYKEPDFVGIRWESGFAVITAEAFAKMPQSKINKLTGGKASEKRKTVRRG